MCNSRAYLLVTVVLHFKIGFVLFFFTVVVLVFAIVLYNWPLLINLLIALIMYR